MEEKYLHIIHQYLNQEIDLEQVKALLSDSEFQEWNKTLEALQSLPYAEFDADKEFNLLQKRKAVRDKPKSYNRFFRIAVALILLLSSTLFLNNYFFDSGEINYVTDAKNYDGIIRLPDESLINLNKFSRITYNKDTWLEDRILNLEGEAYFDVEEGSTFTVNTNNGNVQVLGTTFNVKSKNDIFSVTCYSGKVKVKFSDKEVILNPGQSINSSDIKVYRVEENKPDWLDQKSSYQNTPLADVIRKVELQKGVKIKIDVNDNLYFTGGYTHNLNATEILDLICRSLDLTYEKIKDSTYVITTIEK
jgi:ferric-dicitrate binding protein FerR (iron transport regulator)